MYEACLITNQLKEINQKVIDNIKIIQGMLVEKIIQNEKEKKKFLEVIKMRFSSLERLIEQGREREFKKVYKRTVRILNSILLKIC